tara:strand:+ start:4582 stop:6141 length:1560 start_codon:yes stop_codon:yes gene_type:complete
MASTVTYNGSSPWGVYPPYVNISTQPLNYGNKWGNVTKISLSGSVAEDLIGNLETFKDNVISTFSKSHATFVVDSTTFTGAYVDNVSFPNQRYKGKLDYTVSLTAYDFDSDGILEPSETVEQKVGEDQKITIVHTASAKGLDGGNGFTAARTWVQSRLSGVTHTSTSTGNPAVLISESESSDRTTSTYSLTKTFVADDFGYDSGHFKRHNVSIKESLNGEYKTVDVIAEYSGGKDASMSALAGIVETASDLKTIAETESGLTLNSKPTNQSYDENPSDKRITLKCSFNDDSLFGSNDYHFDYSVTVNEDEVTGVTTISIDGELKTRGPLSARQTAINTFLSANSPPTSFLYNKCNTAYNDISGSPYTLNSRPESISVNKNTNKAILKMSATFSDEDFLADYSESGWSADVNTSIPYIKPAASATENGYYTFQHFNFLTRESVSSNVNITAAENNAPNAKSESDIRTQNQTLTNAVQAAFQGTAPYYIVNEAESIQDQENLSGTQQLERSYESGSQIITM